MKYTYKTKGTCSRSISFDINNGIVTDISFVGGCDGNLKALSKILNGWDYKDIVSKLKGNTCGWKKTSCADQLAIAVTEAHEQEK